MIFPLQSFSWQINKRGECSSKQCAIPPTVKYNITKEGDRCSEELLVGKTLNGTYLIQRAIGAGGQAVVYLATSEGQNYAIKCFKDNVGVDQAVAKREIAILDKIKHRNIIEMINNFEELGHIFLVTEYCETSLHEIIFRGGRIDPNPDAVFFQIVNAVLYLHNYGVSHRDLKPANILIKSAKEPVVKLADFGIATTAKLTTDAKFTGTRRYASPELLANRVGQMWTKNDIFSLGVILFNLHTRQQPWDITGMSSTVDKLLIDFKNKYQFSDSLMEIFRLVFGPSESRPTAVTLRGMVIMNLLQYDLTPPLSSSFL